MIEPMKNKMEEPKQQERSFRVLIADDYETNRLFISLLFEQYRDITCDVAENGKEAVEKMYQYDYDLILMDINMPVLDGISATEIIRNELHSSVPIVALTADSDEKALERFQEYGMNGYLPKPLQLDTLENLLKAFGIL